LNAPGLGFLHCPWWEEAAVGLVPLILEWDSSVIPRHRTPTVAKFVRWGALKQLESRVVNG